MTASENASSPRVSGRPGDSIPVARDDHRSSRRQRALEARDDFEDRMTRVIPVASFRDPSLSGDPSFDERATRLIPVHQLREANAERTDFEQRSARPVTARADANTVARPTPNQPASAVSDHRPAVDASQPRVRAWQFATLVSGLAGLGLGLALSMSQQPDCPPPPAQPETCRGQDGAITCPSPADARSAGARRSLP